VKTVLRCRIFIGDPRSIATDIGVVMEGGFISDVGDFGDVAARTSGAQTRDFDGIICPALINAHTHLELSPFKRVPHVDFVDWVLQLFAARYSRLGDDLSVECLKTKDEAEKQGTSYFVNVGNDFGLNGLLGKNQLFQFEQIGINNDAADDIFNKAMSLAFGKGSVKTALAIHSPYSTSPALMRRIKSFNNDRKAITSVHLAETIEEVEFVNSGKGRMVDLLNARVGLGKWCFGGTGLSPVEYVDSLGVLDDKTLCVHCVFVDRNDLEILRKRGCAVAVCVRSNRNLTGKVPDVARLMNMGIRVLLGTDSKASSPDLDMFAEVSAFYGEFHSAVTPSDVLAMATVNAADFLGIGDRYGEIAPGKNASLVYAPFDGKPEDAIEFMVAEAKGKTEAVFC